MNKNRFNSVTVIVEYNKKAETGFMVGMPMPEIMGGVLRDSGAKGIVVAMDSRLGGATPDEFLRFAVEQARARIFLPGPLPIIWNDLVIDKVQIAYAAALGGAAVTLFPELVDSLPDMVQYCEDMRIEPIIMVKNIDEINLAIDSGAKCLCFHGLDQKQLIALKQQCPSSDKRPDLMYIARFRAESDFSSYFEIDMAWVLRDHGFHTVWPSPEAVFTQGMSDIYPTISALKSKASSQFLSPRQFLMDRKKEGATEFLGDILY
jgi:hypothetical protein